MELLEAEVPLSLRLRRSWSCGDIWDLRKACDDDCVSIPDCADIVDTTSKHSDKFIDDTASTCDDDGVSFVSDETGMWDSIELMPPRLDWAEEMEESEVPRSWEIFPSFGVAIPSQSFAIHTQQWNITIGKLDGPPGKFLGHLGNMDASENPQNGFSANTHADLVKSVKNLQKSNPEAWFSYTAAYGNNTRDPRKHTVQFLEDFLRQYNAPGKECVSSAKLTSFPEKLEAPPGQLQAPITEKLTILPGKLAGPLPESEKRLTLNVGQLLGIAASA